MGGSVCPLRVFKGVASMTEGQGKSPKRRRIWDQLATLHQERKGAAAMMLAAALVPMVAATGAAVDGAYALMTRSSLSSAVDAAALAGARAFNDSDAATQARGFFDSNFQQQQNASVRINNFTTQKTEADGRQTFKVEASARVETVFMRMFGLRQLNVSAKATAIRETTGLELVLALDNTGSMQIDAGGQTRIQALKTATKDLLDILYGGAESNARLLIGIVPYTSFVNVGGLLQAEQTATGARYLETIAGYAFNPADPYQWKGCVDAEPTNRNINALTNINDNGAQAAAWDVKDFVPGAGTNPRIRPAMYPSFKRMERYWDDGQDCGNEPRRWVEGYWTQAETIPGRWEDARCDEVWIEGERTLVNCTPRRWIEPRTVPARFVEGHWTGRDPNCVQGAGAGWKNRETYDFGYNIRVGQWNDPRFPAPNPAWQNPNPYPDWTNGDRAGGWHSPNMYCPAEAILPEARTKSSLRTYIDTNMKAWDPAWGTFSNMGMLWAWRMLTPEAPFVGQPRTSNMPKAIVMMTDGLLYVPKNEGYARSPYGFHHEHYADDRLSVPNSSKEEQEEALAKRMEIICNNAKAQGISVYTVTFAIQGNDSRKDLYRRCATSPSAYFDAPDAQALRTSFQKIAADLTSLRLVE
jgi:Flp pilus assembly protein TadG